MHRQCAECPGANIGEMIPISNKVVDTGRVTYQVVVGSSRQVAGMCVNEHCSKSGVCTREKTEQVSLFVIHQRLLVVGCKSGKRTKTTSK
jgi:hypothetical protein